MAIVTKESVFAPGLRALRTAWKPILLIQSILVFVVVGYYFAPAVGRFLESVAEFKNQTGIWFALGVGFFSGGVLPELARAATGQVKNLDREFARDTVYTGFVYAVIAVCVWVLYAILESLFGPTTSYLVLAKKVLVDQLIFSPFVSIPVAFHLFGWREVGFKASYFKNVFIWEFYKTNVGPPLVMCWAFWGPTVTCIYLFPINLQFVISAFCQGVWSLIFVLMVRAKLAE